MIRAATFLRRLVRLGMAFALLVPATAWGAHSLRHDPPGAGVAENHRPAASLSDEAVGEPAEDHRDGGHDHQLGLSVPVGILFGETSLEPPPLAVSPPPEAVVTTLLLRGGEPPPADPPRTF